VNAWAMYEWANSAFAVIILTAISRCTTALWLRPPGTLPKMQRRTEPILPHCLCWLSPWLAGAGGDRRYHRRQEAVPGRRIGIGRIGFAESGVLSKDTFLLGALVFAIANLGFAGGNIFYEALLPNVARVDDIDRVSARGYALGYLGGGLLLIINIFWLLRPDWFWMRDREFALRASLPAWRCGGLFLLYRCFARCRSP